MAYNIILENALQNIFKTNCGNKDTIEKDIINYRKTSEYQNLQLIQKAFLIVELDKLKKLDLSLLYKQYIIDKPLYTTFNILIKNPT
jgi:hypothetical protein